MLVELDSIAIQALIDKISATLKQELVDIVVMSAPTVVNYNALSRDTSIDNYLSQADEFCDTVQSLYLELITVLRHQAEADASPRAYWDLGEKLLLRSVADAISSMQDDMRSENNDSTFQHYPS